MNPQSFRTRLVMLLLLVLIPAAVLLLLVNPIIEGTTPVLSVQVVAPKKALFATADSEFVGSLIGILLIGLLVLRMAWWYSKRAFLRPFGAMLAATDRISNGDLTARTGVGEGKSELHLLAQHFDAMAETLSIRQRELENANAEIKRNNVLLEARVRERTSELESLNQELEAFSYSVSHDLRAPHRHMNGFAQILVSDESLESNPTAQRYLGSITESAKRMGTLIDDLLEFSRMARQSMSRTAIDMAEMVRVVISEINAQESNRAIDWKVRTLPGVNGDRAMIRQVWWNLLTNAVKYTRGKERAKIEIDSNGGQDEYVFSVQDNGAGFDMKFADNLFGVFQRLHTEREFEGTGIGLANVRRIISRHGGRTWAEAEVGKGAKFFFSLPKVENDLEIQSESVSQS